MGVIFEGLGFGRAGIFFEEDVDDAEFSLNCANRVFFVDDGFSHFEVEKVLFGFVQKAFLQLKPLTLKIAISGVGIGGVAGSEMVWVKIVDIEEFGASYGLGVVGVVGVFVFVGSIFVKFVLIFLNGEKRVIRVSLAVIEGADIAGPFGVFMERVVVFGDFE
jgi:hypothetical protein